MAALGVGVHAALGGERRVRHQYADDGQRPGHPFRHPLLDAGGDGPQRADRKHRLRRQLLAFGQLARPLCAQPVGGEEDDGRVVLPTEALGLEQAPDVLGLLVLARKSRPLLCLHVPQRHRLIADRLA